jgi:hypothetical protein
MFTALSATIQRDVPIRRALSQHGMKKKPDKGEHLLSAAILATPISPCAKRTI